MKLDQEALDFEAPAVDPWRLAQVTNKCAINSCCHLNVAVYIISFMITGGISVGDQCPQDHRELPIGCIGQELLAISTLHVPP